MRLLVTLLLIIFSGPFHDSSYRLAIRINGLEPHNGNLYVAVHDRPDFFQTADSAFVKKMVPVKSGSVMVTFHEIPEGLYAVAVYHDENLNGIMDTRQHGIPVEGYGFSNNPKMAGRPKFEQAAFNITADTAIEINMLYSKNKEKRD